MGRFLARNYVPEQMKAVSYSRDIPTADAKQREAQKTLSRHESEGVTLHTVKWKGYGDSFNSEIPYKNFDSKKLVADHYI